jgi:hypothetical protein
MKINQLGEVRERELRYADDSVLDEHGSLSLLDVYKLEAQCPKHVPGGAGIWAVNLTSLRGSPQTVGAVFTLGGTRIKTLEGGPKKVGALQLIRNRELSNLEGCPEITGAGAGTGLKVEDCGIVELVGAPRRLEGDLTIKSCRHLKSLEGCPMFIEGSAWLTEVKADNALQHLPTIVTQYYQLPFELDCTFKELTNRVKFAETLAIGGKLDGPMLSLLKVEGLRMLTTQHIHEDTDWFKAFKIVTKYIPVKSKSAIIDCQDELMEAGLEYFAEL